MAVPPRLDFRIDAGDVLSKATRMRLWVSDQLPFATAAALTDTAREARDHTAGRLGRFFRLRNRSLGNALVSVPASKRDPTPTAIVGVRPWASFLVLQVTGGTKRAQGGTRVAVPTRIVRRTSSGAVASAHRPRRLRQRKGLDVRALEEHGQIALREGKRAQRARGLFYFLVPQARIRRRWPFDEEVRELVRARLPVNFEKRAEQALRPR